MNFVDFNDYLKKTNNPKPINYYTNMGIIKENLHKRQPKLERIPTRKLKKMVIIDSRDRDTTFYPNSNRFKINVASSPLLDTGTTSSPILTSSNATLQTRLRNIQHIRLDECVVPDFTGSVPYLILKIPELQPINEGTNNQLRNSFAILIPDTIHGSFVTCETTSPRCQKTFTPPLANLSHFTVEFYDPDGDLYNFGSNEIMLILEICYLEVDNKVLEPRLIF